MPNESVSVWGNTPHPKTTRPQYRITETLEHRITTRFQVHVARGGAGGWLGWTFDTSWDTYAEAVERIKALSSAGKVTMFDAAGQILPDPL